MMHSEWMVNELKKYRAAASATLANDLSRIRDLIESQQVADMFDYLRVIRHRQYDPSEITQESAALLARALNAASDHMDTHGANVSQNDANLLGIAMYFLSMYAVAICYRLDRVSPDLKQTRKEIASYLLNINKRMIESVDENIITHDAIQSAVKDRDRFAVIHDLIESWSLYDDDRHAYENNLTWLAAQVNGRPALLDAANRLNTMAPR